MPVLTSPPPKPPTDAEVALDLGPRRQERLDLLEARGRWRRGWCRPASGSGAGSRLVSCDGHELLLAAAASMPKTETTKNTQRARQHQGAVVQRRHERRAGRRAASRAKARSTRAAEPPRRSPTSRKREQRIGASVSASSSESSTATEIVTPNWKKNLPMMPFMKATGRKIATIARGRGRGGEGDLAGADRGRLHLALAHLAVPVDVLEHHDRVVDHDADRQRQAEHGEGVEREAEEVDHDEGAEDRGRDREQHVEGRRPRAEEEPAHEAGQERRQDQREQDLVDRLLDEGGGVEVDAEDQAFGQLLAQLRHPAP